MVSPTAAGYLRDDRTLSASSIPYKDNIICPQDTAAALQYSNARFCPIEVDTGDITYPITCT